MEQEGVIKYQLAFKQTNIAPAAACLEQINLARREMCLLGLIGQDSNRYDGYGFGNISLRCAKGHEAFWISGTQTGHLKNLSKNDVCLVTQSYPDLNTIIAQGSIHPSSESMTHGVLYQLSDHFSAVIHVHSPDIWRESTRLSLPTTPSNVPYGTPEMAQAVYRLAKSQLQTGGPLLFCMDGHEDGIVAAAESLSQCVEILRKTFRDAQPSI